MIVNYLFIDHNLLLINLIYNYNYLFLYYYIIIIINIKYFIIFNLLTHQFKLLIIYFKIYIFLN